MDWTDSATYSSSSNVITSIANKITLSPNSSGSTLTDYQIPIFVNTSTQNSFYLGSLVIFLNFVKINPWKVT